MFDETYPLRTRICGAIGIDILSSDAELFSAILALTTKQIDMSEGVRIDLCNMLELDYLTSRDMDIYQAVALQQVEAEALRARVEKLEHALSELANAEANYRLSPNNQQMQTNWDAMRLAGDKASAILCEKLEGENA